DVVQPPLELLEQVRARDALPAVRPREGQPELALEEAVDPLDLLLLAQLDAVAEKLAPPPAVLAGRIVAALDRALVLEAAVPFQEQLHAFAPAEPANRIAIAGQTKYLLDPSFRLRPSSRPGPNRRFTDAPPALWPASEALHPSPLPRPAAVVRNGCGV